MQFVALCLAVLDFVKSFNFSGWGARLLFVLCLKKAVCCRRKLLLLVLFLMGESPDGMLWAESMLMLGI